LEELITAAAGFVSMMVTKPQSPAAVWLIRFLACTLARNQRTCALAIGRFGPLYTS